MESDWVLLLGTKQQLAKVDINSITVGESVVNTKPVVRNLGSWFDSQLSMSTHISKLCSSAFFHLHNITRIRKFLSPVETKSLVHAFVNKPEYPPPPNPRPTCQVESRLNVESAQQSHFITDGTVFEAIWS